MKRTFLLVFSSIITILAIVLLTAFLFARNKHLDKRTDKKNIYEYASNGIVYLQESFYFQLPIRDKDTLFITFFEPLEIFFTSFNRKEINDMALTQSGTGFIIDSTGLIMTNRHVVSVPSMKELREVLYENLNEDVIPDKIDFLQIKVEGIDAILKADTASIALQDSLREQRKLSMKQLENYFRVKDYLEISNLEMLDRLSIYSFNRYIAFNQEKYEKGDSLKHLFRIEYVSEDSISDLALVHLDKEYLPKNYYPLSFHADTITSYKYWGNGWWNDFLIWIGIKSPAKIVHTQNLKVGDRLYSASYNLGLENVDTKRGFAPSFIQGTLMLPPNDDNLQVNADNTHGASGSPFLDSLGNVVGVLTSGNDISYINVIPNGRISNFLTQYYSYKKYAN